jgi:hypothetical protein
MAVMRVVPKPSQLEAIEKVRVACAELCVMLASDNGRGDFAIQYSARQNTVLIVDVITRSEPIR